jgi:LacI family transcriptional regulator
LSIPARYHGRGTRWLDGLLTCQYRVPEECRIPLFIDRGEEDSRGSFRDWLTTWRPEVLLTLYGDEIRWLAEMNLAVPRDIGVACLIHPPGSTYAGINDRYDLIGEATVELVASKIALNQYGIPAVSKLLLIEGYWINGSSVRKKGRKRVPSS